MKKKLGLIILITFAFVLGTCSTWEGDNGIVNIRIVGDSGTSGGSNSRAIVGDGETTIIKGQGGLDLMELFYDIYFVKEIYPNGGKIPKDNIGDGNHSVKYGTNVTCSLVPGTWILIIIATNEPRGMYEAQGVKHGVEIKPGRNEDITIEIKAIDDNNGYYKGTNF